MVALLSALDRLWILFNLREWRQSSLELLSDSIFYFSWPFFIDPAADFFQNLAYPARVKSECFSDFRIRVSLVDHRHDRSFSF